MERAPKWLTAVLPSVVRILLALGAAYLAALPPEVAAAAVAVGEPLFRGRGA